MASFTSGDFAVIAGAVSLTSQIVRSNQSVIAITGNQTGLTLGLSQLIYVSSNTEPLTVGSFSTADIIPGRDLIIRNGGSRAVTFLHEDSSSTATNRLSLPYGLDVPLRPYDTYGFAYDNTLQRWVLHSGYEMTLLDPKYCASFYEEFLNSAGNGFNIIADLGWSLATSGGGSLQSAQGGANEYGTAKINCQTLNSYTVIGGSNTTYIPTNHGFMFETFLRPETLSNGTENADILVGLAPYNSTGTTAGGGIVNGIYFLYEQPSSANWQCCTVSSSSKTQNATSTVVSTSGQTHLRFVLNTAQNLVTFYINDMISSVNSISTNIPAAGTYLAPFIINKKTAGMTSFMSVYLDAWRGIRVGRVKRSN